MKHRIVLDTNCLLASISRKGKYYSVWRSIVDGKTTLCVSNDILYEYREILEQQLNEILADSVLALLVNLPNVEILSPSFLFRLIESDPDDNKFVDCAIAANARFIVSNDHHFNELKEIDFPRVNVVSLSEFLKMIETKR